jgi:hypothetical protein
MRAKTGFQNWNKELAQKLDWLQTLVKDTTWSCVLMMGSVPPQSPELCCSVQPWQRIRKWPDVYDQIMRENINRVKDESDGSPFDFVCSSMYVMIG